MKNKVFYISIFFIFLFIVNMNICCAEVFKGKITGTGVRLRSGPGTNYDALKTVSKNDEYTLVNNTKYSTEKGCSNGWYKIYYEGSATGFVCSDYVSVQSIVFKENATTECEITLANLGFPSSYWPGLCSLKEKHSAWQFKPVHTNLDWSTAVENESACGKSYIASNVATNIDSTCHNEYTSTWYPASSSAVAYYMDPRNFFTEQHIFQFEYLKYDNDISSLYPSAVTSVISHAAFYKYHLNLNNNLGDIISAVGAETKISPIFIGARILQEMGSGEKLYNLYSGVYEGYNEYYNFYNFGVSDSCANTNGTTYCGLEYAKKNNWYGLNNAIKGGASQLAESYINKNQYTTYLQKYNVYPLESNKLYTHQYMTNIAAPSSESKTTYKTYNELNLLNNVFVFYIPVYKNMDQANYSENNGAVDVPDKGNTSTMDISTIVTSSGFTYTSTTISGIGPETSVSALKSSLESIAGAGTVRIKTKDNNIVTDGVVGTGYKVTINNAKREETLTIVINGDTSGDGKINALDLLQVQKSILGTYTLSGEYSLAGDASDDGVINALDLLQVQKNILGTYTIKQ